MLEALFLDGLVRMVVVKWTCGSALHTNHISKFTRVEWADTGNHLSGKAACPHRPQGDHLISRSLSNSRDSP